MTSDRKTKCTCFVFFQFFHDHSILLLDIFLCWKSLDQLDNPPNVNKYNMVLSIWSFLWGNIESTSTTFFQTLMSAAARHPSGPIEAPSQVPETLGDRKATKLPWNKPTRFFFIGIEICWLGFWKHLCGFFHVFWFWKLEEIWLCLELPMQRSSKSLVEVQGCVQV